MLVSRQSLSTGEKHYIAKIELEFTFYTVCPWEAHGSTDLSKFPDECTCCRSYSWNVLITPEGNPLPLSSQPPSPCRAAPGNHPSAFHPLDLPLLHVPSQWNPPLCGLGDRPVVSLAVCFSCGRQAQHPSSLPLRPALTTLVP